MYHSKLCTDGSAAVGGWVCVCVWVGGAHGQPVDERVDRLGLQVVLPGLVGLFRRDRCCLAVGETVILLPPPPSVGS